MTHPSPIAEPLSAGRSKPRVLYALVMCTGATTFALSVPQPGKVYLALGVALGAFVWLLALELRERRLTLRPVVICGVVLTTLAIVFPMRTSRDIWAYADYGQMIARHNASPYASVPADFPDDFWFGHVYSRWQHQGSVYGPLFAGTAALFMKVAGDSLLVTRLLFQAFAALIIAAIAWLVWRRTRDPVALACVIVNPLVVVGVVNGGHNDPLLALGLLAAILLLERKMPAAAGVAIALGALVKVVAVLPAAAIGFWLWRRRSARDAAAFAIPFVAVTLVGFALAGGTEVLRPLRSASELVGFPSLWHAILRMISGGTFRGESAARGREIVRALSGLTVFLLASATIILRTRRTGARSTAAAAIVVYLLAASYVLPWYAIWVIPIAALAWSTRLSLITFVYSSLLQMSYFPLATRTGGVIRGIRTVFTSIMAPVEIAALIAVIVLSIGPRSRYGSAATPGGV